MYSLIDIFDDNKSYRRNFIVKPNKVEKNSPVGNILSLPSLKNFLSILTYGLVVHLVGSCGRQLPSCYYHISIRFLVKITTPNRWVGGQTSQVALYFYQLRV